MQQTSPSAPDSGADRQDAPTQASSAALPDAARVLIVEDSRTQAQQMSWAIEAEGYRVSVAADGAAALVAARSERPDAVVSDVEMPGIDGFELCSRMKSDPVLSGIPFIICTGYGRMTDVARALEVGADNYVTKPIDFVNLATVLSRSLAAAGTAALGGNGTDQQPAAPSFSIERGQVVEVLRAAAQRLEEEFEEVTEIGAALTMTHDLGVLLATLAARTRDLAGADLVSVWLPDPGNSTWRAEAVAIRAPLRLSASGRRRVTSDPQSFFSFDALARGQLETVALDDEGVPDDIRDFSRSAGLTRAFGFPMVAVGDLVGAIGLWYSVHPPELSPNERRRMRQLAAQAGIAIKNARTYERLQRTTSDLERSNRDLSDFASIASHDLQEPLRKIQAFGDRLQDRLAEHPDETVHDYLRRMVGAAMRMQSLIQDVLAYSRIAKGDQDGVRTLDLGMVVDAVLQDLDEMITATAATIEVGELPTIEGHPEEFQQVFHNLLENALKYYRPGVPPVVRVSSQRVAPRSGANERPGWSATWEIAVADNGIGFENAYAERVFAPFERLHGRNEYGGNGMGLAIVRRILERRGGAIRATGEPGTGAIFTITTPASIAG